MDFQYEGFRVADGHIIIEMHLPMPVNTDLISSESVNTESITTAPVTTVPVTTAHVTTAPVNAVSTYVEPIEENLPTEDEPIALINSLVGRLKNLRNKQQLLLPIKKVKNINVEVTITKTNKKF